MPYDKVLQENIEFLELEERIVQLEEFRKLLLVKQNGLAYVLYPYARNNRWDHSVGTMYWATHLYRSIFGVEKSSKDNNFKAARLAALVHDIGHGPFSHALELLIDRNPKLLDYEPWKELIQKFGNRKPHELLTLNFVESEIFRKLIPREIRRKVYEILRKKSPASIIISGDLDADRLDYLLRDSDHSGLPFGLNVKPIFNELIQQNLQIQTIDSKSFLRIDSDGVPAFEQLLMARYAHYYYIAYAPKILFANLAFVSALEKSLWENIKRPEKAALATFYIFSELNDDELLNLDFSNVEKKKRKLLNRIKTSTLRECFENLEKGNSNFSSNFIRLCTLGKELTFDFFKSKITYIKELEEIVSARAKQPIVMYLCLPQALTTRTLVYDKDVKEKYRPSLVYDYSPVVRALEQKMYLDCGIVISSVKPISYDKTIAMFKEIRRERTDFETKTCAILKYIKKAKQSFDRTEWRWILRRSRIFEFLEALEKSFFQKGWITEKSEFVTPWYSVEVYELLQKLEFLDALDEDFNLSLGDGFIPSYIYSIGEYGEELLQQLQLTAADKAKIDKFIRSYVKELKRKRQLV